MKANTVNMNLDNEDCINESYIVRGCKQYSETCKSATEALLGVFQDALDSGWDRDDLIVLGVTKGELAESTVRGLVSKAAIKAGKRQCRSAVRLSKEARDFMAYVMKYKRAHSQAGLYSPKTRRATQLIESSLTAGLRARVVMLRRVCSGKESATNEDQTRKVES